jgi:N-hydroxyarylamine O-acetyltransferase
MPSHPAPPPVDLDAYFGRIGYAGPREPTLAVLQALHELHPAAITFEAIDCLLDRPISLAPADVDDKLIRRGRGGYCFEQNSLFFRALQALGFAVSPLAARVRWGRPPGPPPPRTHRVTRVEIEGVSYLADVGFGGCVLTAPLRLAPRVEQVTRHDTYRLVPFPGGVTLEVFRDEAWLPAWDLPLDPCEDADFEMANWWTSTHPSSHFRHNLLAARTTPEARYAILFNRFTVRPVGGLPSRTTLDADGIESVLCGVFGLPVEASWRPLIEAAGRVTSEPSAHSTTSSR